ncbi:MAG: hypothetical protein RMJ17_01670 [Candidatus Aenigmarchaeota archaeon]|nr:hypothetical protein [Candidatus Aenigmarchaeota archaeon]MDW8149285.1 hypothetical protein [Candidatus Aenigmarchaeota archaeon]
MKKGYRSERKIRKLLEKNGWLVIRAAGSFGDADLVCFKNGKCIFLQVKSTKNSILYYKGYKKEKIEGFPFYVVVDFGYNKIKVFKPKEKMNKEDGKNFFEFLGSKF